MWTRAQVVPSFIDLEKRRTRDIPAPNEYNAPRGHHASGGRFSTSVVLSNVDVLCREAAKLPGPGQYRPKQKKKHGFAKSTSEGSAISIAANQTAYVPGPGHYGNPGRCDEPNPGKDKPLDFL
jgi:hypothetical protein